MLIITLGGTIVSLKLIVLKLACNFLGYWEFCRGRDLASILLEWVHIDAHSVMLWVQERRGLKWKASTGSYIITFCYTICDGKRTRWAWLGQATRETYETSCLCILADALKRGVVVQRHASYLVRMWRWPYALFLPNAWFSGNWTHFRHFYSTL